MASLSQEEENYVRMSLLLTGISPRAARHFFNQEFAPVCLDSSLKKEYNKLLELRKTHRINQLQWNLLFPRFPDVADSKTFDITLMITLLRNLTNMYPPNGGFDCLPTKNETTPGADLARIRYYRNYLAHLDEGKVLCSEFNSAWEIIPEAIERLGGQHLKLECDQLKTKTLDQTNTEIMMDIKRSNDEIKELKESLNSLKRSHEALQDDHVDMTKEIQRLKTCQEDTVPWNVRARINDTLKAWQDNDDKMFIKTRAAQQVVTCIKENSCVLITASSGVGKTTILRHTALRMAGEEYDVLLVTDPGDIVKFNNPIKKTLFVVDDLCGNFSVDQSDIKIWEPVMEDIINILDKKQTKILGACRLQVYKDEKFESLLVFKTCVCNLLSDDMCLLKSEKQSIAELYLKTKSTEITDFYNLYDCFPLLCKLYHDNPKLNIIDFFQNPFSVYEADIDKLLKRGHSTKYCALALCVMFNNNLEVKILTDEVNGEIRTIIENTCEACKLDRGTSRLVLLDELDSLQGTFIKKEQNLYKIIHDKLFDFLAYFCGQKIINCLIKNADRGLIKERFVLEIENGIDQFIIVIPPKYHQMYIQRMIDDWSKGHVQDVFSNINMKIPRFRQIFLSYLNTLDIPFQRQLVHIREKRKQVRHKLNYWDNYYWADNDTVLIKCCLTGDISFTKWCCKFDNDVNKCNRYGESPLMKASEHGHKEIAFLLLDRGAKCNNVNIIDESPVVKACKNGHTEIVKILLDRGADCTKYIDERDDSLVLKACMKGQKEIVQLLLDNGAECNRCDDDGLSPLLFACKNGQTEILQMLLDKGVDCKKRDRYDKSPLDYACERGHREIVYILLAKGTDSNHWDEDGYSPLIHACTSGNTEIVQMLLDKGADCNQFGENRLSPLVCACISGHTEIIKLLLDKIADCNKCDWRNEPPLLNACMHGCTEIVQMLLDKGADCNKCDKDGKSPVMNACMNGQTEIVQMLLDKGANCNKYDWRHEAPLVIARKHGHMSCGNSPDLVRKGTDFIKCNNMVMSSVLNACKLGQTEIIKMLLESGVDCGNFDADGESPLLSACLYGHTEIVLMLLDTGGNCNYCNSDGHSPLRNACIHGHLETVKLLLDKGADCNQCGWTQESPLFIACKHNHREIVKLLLDKGADCNQWFGLTQESPLKIARKHKYTEIVQMLLDKDADCTTGYSNDQSILMNACINGNTEIVKLLIDKGTDCNKYGLRLGSPLLNACKHGRTEIVKMLLEKGAVYKQSIWTLQSPLSYACTHGHAEIVQLLLDDNGYDLNGESHLMNACIKLLYKNSIAVARQRDRL